MPARPISLSMAALAAAWSIAAAASAGQESDCPYGFSMSHKTLDEVTACLEAGEDPNGWLSRWGDTPLHAVANDTTDPAVVRALLDAGADIEAREDYWDHTPFDKAAINNGNPAVVRALLDAGADPKARDVIGQTPLDMALGNPKLAGTDVLRRLRALQ